jgi:ABC-2 family transporter protein
MNEGYALLQNWAANAILKQATGNINASIATTVIPFQSLPVSIDNYVRVLQAVLPFFFLLMYIPVLYRTVYRVVFEKVTRAKESMRMMGMGEFAYWLSWFTYFTIVNTILVTLSWGILMINSLPLNAGGFLWLFIWLYGESLFGLLLII